MISDRYVILHIRAGPPYPDPVKSPQVATAGRFELSDEIGIERLDSGTAERIQRACEPANYGVNNEVRDRHLYAFVRRIPERKQQKYEGLLDLYTIVALSRLVHPTSTGDRYCAKIFPAPQDDPAIQAVQATGVSPDVFLGDASEDWLSPQDGVELRRLVPWVSAAKPMHRPVHRAYWNHEQAMRTYYLDMRWNLVVSGLEALVTAGDGDPARGFATRAGNLANELGIAVSRAELRKAYLLRSKLAHAEGFLYELTTLLPQDAHRPLYDKLESLLRAAVKKCLLDETFGAIFAGKRAEISRRWS